MGSQNLPWRYLTENDNEEYSQQSQLENEILVSLNKTRIVSRAVYIKPSNCLIDLLLSFYLNLYTEILLSLNKTRIISRAVYIKPSNRLIDLLLSFYLNLYTEILVTSDEQN